MSMAELTVMPSSPCPVCQGTGWVVGAGAGARRCDCLKESRGARLLERARVPPRYKHCDLANFEIHNDSHARARVIAQKFLQDYPVSEVGLLFLGPCGSGKTHLAVAILKALMLQKNIACLFYDFRELIRDIQLSFNDKSQSSEEEILVPVLETEVLVLDELGAAKPTEWVQEQMWYVINRRYNHRKVTLFTSNYLDEAAERGDATLAERVGRRLRSRLYEMCHDVVITADDYRKKIRRDQAKLSLQ